MWNDKNPERVDNPAGQPPRLVEFVWGRGKTPTVTLVGKGVVFDTGGLNIKPGVAMSLMKKDMGGAAIALSLAKMIMDAGLPIRVAQLSRMVSAKEAVEVRKGVADGSVLAWPA